ncbi:GFA family protein [Parendozoicomonas haliclonae]|uniref:GFA family protein n=1 Tax=Parendozoicomonas haliclonae TaxID=1960125 RepID=UPI000B352662
MMETRGKCSCGSIEWKASAKPFIVLNCHCNTCRAMNGADYSPWVIFKSSDYSIISGAEHLHTYNATEHFSKCFCKKCGSTIHAVNNKKFPNHTYVSRGNITESPRLKTNIQVYTNNKVDWVELPKDIPEINP